MTGRRLRPPWRRRLRVLQLGAGVWTTVALVEVFTAHPAAADNCSVFTDCFGVANSAVEAAFGLALLAALSMVLDFVPVVGTVKGLVEAATGRDLLTGQELAAWERALGVLPVVGGLAALGGLGRLARVAPDVPTRLPDPPTTPPRVRGEPPRVPTPTPPRPPGSPPTPPRHAPIRGTSYPYSGPRVQQYRQPGTSPSTRRTLSEQIGEDGALRYLQDVGNDPRLTILRPTSSGQVQSLVTQVDDGVAWNHAVAFNGRNVTNVVYFDGDTLHIVEAKGGNGMYIDRESTSVLGSGQRINQTHPEYPRDVAGDMATSPLQDGRNELGELIERMYAEDRVRYVGVRTGPRAELLNGNPQTVVEHVMKEPHP
ncbi:pre-toxin TG domain-containing protein [Cellulomonas sp. S1-8]|uniref:pre-toxin TG domain-containing protein n=1 Tax=Cellulomonas sp. S1-8 TaxID=2904790 RepID=UPI002242E05D|nr:pre-toxin TG domain-containing protein [Cellulomonas sp. S1-8]UZN02111.1 pre-toxin TG domain-containing protein [Cellulomonas sp. S1-8]